MRWKDLIAALIAGGLVTWGIILMAGLAWRGTQLSKAGGEIFLAIATGLVTCLGVYFSRNGGS